MKRMPKPLSFALALCLAAGSFLAFFAAAPLQTQAAVTGATMLFYNAPEAGAVATSSTGTITFIIHSDNPGPGRESGYLWFDHTASDGTVMSTVLEATDFPVNQAATYTVDFLQGYGHMYSELKMDGNIIWTGTTPVYPPAPGDDYQATHDNFWLPVFIELNALGYTGTVNVDTAGYEIDHIRHFVFDALAGTNRTLVVKHKGETYRINGRNMASIALGHNHKFVGNLDGYMV